MEGETVIAGVDTHKDVHVLCLLDGLGRKIWSGSFGADPEGYDRLAEAIGDPGSCMVVGVEGTASYGAGLTRRLVELGYNVVEVLRPKRDKARPGEGKSDPLDAERAARKAASGRVLASIYFSPFPPTHFRQSRQRGCAGFANADAPLSASRLPPPSRPHRRWIRPSGGTTVPLS